MRSSRAESTGSDSTMRAILSTLTSGSFSASRTRSATSGNAGSSKLPSDRSCASCLTNAKAAARAASCSAQAVAAHASTDASAETCLTNSKESLRNCAMLAVACVSLRLPCPAALRG
ncbi:MAG: hypothetical protein IPF57_22390 [Gammaproteobacteria bacterium]|nr:hypothetical protein [Gammaproteobacteria bacterium]